MPTPLQQALTQRFQQLDPSTPYYPTQQQAWQRFKQLGLPTAADEAYQYTPLAEQLAEQWKEPPPDLVSPKTLTTFFKQQPKLDGYPIVFVNGQLQPGATSCLATQAVQLLSFQQAYQQHPDLYSQYIATQQHNTQALTALNTALAETGYLLWIPEHTILEKPILLYYLTHNPLAFPRLRVVASANSQVSLVTAWHTLENNFHFTNALTELVLHHQAQLTYYVLQNDLKQAYHCHTTQAYQVQPSTLKAYTYTGTGTLVRNNFTCSINAPHSETHLYGISCLKDQQHVDHCIQLDHRQPHTTSFQHYKSILTGTATGVFNGRIFVQPAAQKTQAFQQSQSIILTEKAQHYTKPQLEIWADDVKCSHGATTGALDENQIFYLKTRGIPQQMARRLLLHAFAKDILEQIPIPAIQTYCTTALDQQLSVY